MKVPTREGRKRTLAMVLVVLVALVAAACTGPDAESTTTSPAQATSEAPLTTSTTNATMATLSASGHLVTAEAVVAAVYDGDEAALDDLPWFNPNGPGKEDAVGTALFGEALNVTVLSSSCAVETAQSITCNAQVTDDLVKALGGSSVAETYVIGFNDSGEITEFVPETHDGGVGEVFTNWAWNIAYPGLCDSPTQCAAALLGVVDEYYETYPGATVASYVTAYNAGNVDAVMALFDEDALIIGHPGGDYTSVADIRTLHDDEADGTVAYNISNLAVDGNTVTWDHHWGQSDDNGEIIDGFCVEGHTAQIEDGMIALWTWPFTDFQCD